MITIPDWLYEFHGHKCPFVVMGYRMGLLALNELGVGRIKNHEMFVFSEMGIGHPQGCLQDGIQAATSATFGKGQMHKLFYGKIAAVFYYPGKTPLRMALKNEFSDKLAPHEFFHLRKQGVAPSEVPAGVADDIVKAVLAAPDEELFNLKQVPDFSFQPVKGSFNKEKCEVCGEYVFERYLRRRDRKLVCIPCSGQEPAERTIYLPLAKGE
ncbi:MAG: FmdE family protein [Calditrichia bacterium]